MKKLLMMALVALAVCTTSFAKTYVMDMADSNNGSTVKISKNKYAPGYQSELPVDVTKYLNGAKLVPGDVIEFHYNFTSNVDINWINLVVVDNCEKAKYWMELSEWKGIGNIQAGKVSEGVIEYKIKKQPIQNVVLVFDTQDKVEATFKATKTGVKSGSIK